MVHLVMGLGIHDCVTRRGVPAWMIPAADADHQQDDARGERQGGDQRQRHLGERAGRCLGRDRRRCAGPPGRVVAVEPGDGDAGQREADDDEDDSQ